MTSEPRFGEADLTNCERELIHLPGSIQPHGVLLVLDASAQRIRQASTTTARFLGTEPGKLLGQELAALDPILARRTASLLAAGPLSEPQPVRAMIVVDGTPRGFEGAVHRAPSGEPVIELMPAYLSPTDPEIIALPEHSLLQLMSAALRRFGQASSLGALANDAARACRDVTGYDRVMIYRFDPEGHGQIIAEARDPRLESLVGHRYPASDIPQRARDLYISNRVRVLVDVHYEASPLVGLDDSASPESLDMSMCYLRSMSPLHLQYLKNMGVTATLVISLVRNGRLWGLVAAHHSKPRNLSFAVRASCALMGEAIATRIAAIENYAHARVAIQVRRLEQRLIEATSSEGDWRLALFRNPNTLLRPLEATGAVLFFDHSIQTAGEVPSTPELRALLDWIDANERDGFYRCVSIGTENPALASLTPLASGVLAVRLSTGRPEYLVWLRKEQLESVTWAGDPNKPMVTDDPLTLSPRRSFAAWSEIVRGKALPWSQAEIAMGRAIGTALVDIILQVHAVRLLIANHQITEIRSALNSSREPAAVFDAKERLLFCNESCNALMFAAPLSSGIPLSAFLHRFEGAPDDLVDRIRAQLSAGETWRGDLNVRHASGGKLTLRMRADIVPGPGGESLGMVLSFVDMTSSVEAAQARARLEQSLTEVGTPAFARDDMEAVTSDELLQVIVSNASMAAMDIADGAVADFASPAFEEVEESTRRANRLREWIQASFRED